MAKGKVQTAPDPDHEQQPADETIAAGEHMDVEAMDRAVDAERRAGAPMPTGYNPTVSQGQPNLSEEMQGMELIPKTFGPPQYGSPDPASAASRLMTLEDGHPLGGLEDGTAAISDDYAATTAEASAGVRRWSEIDATDDAKELADEEHDVNLAAVEGTGKDGRILKSDVQSVIDDSENSD